MKKTYQKIDMEVVSMATDIITESTDIVTGGGTP